MLLCMCALEMRDSDHILTGVLGEDGILRGILDEPDSWDFSNFTCTSGSTSCRNKT